MKAARLLTSDGEGDGWNTLQGAADELEKVLEGLAEAAAPFHAYGHYLAAKRADCERALGISASTA